MFRRLAVGAILVSGLLLAGCLGGSSPASDRAPQALFEFGPSVPAVGEPVVFQASSNGSIVAWAWQFGDGDVGHGLQVEHTYRTAGIYEVELEVKDGKGRIDKASQFLQVGGGRVAGGLQVDFTYSVSQKTVDFEPIVRPSNASVDQFYWDLGDGQTSKEPAPIHTYESIGEYVVELRIATVQGVAKAIKRVAVGVPSSDASGLAGRSFAVIAIVDSGINPYHDEFAAAEFQDHPATYVDGYPVEAMPLELALDARTYTDAVRTDKEVWSEVKPSTLYWVPGTRIIGAISVEARGAIKILDDGADGGHGTATASDAAGASLGACPDCLIVIVEGLGQAPLEWALRQPWIDVVSNSWSSEICVVACPASTNLAPPVIADADATRAAVEAGKEVLFASGNGALNAFESPQITYWNTYSGPDWVVTVGAAEASSGSTVVGTGRPVDVVSYGLGWRAAAHNSMDAIREFGGTSAATPIVAGAYGSVLQKVRESMADTQEGPREPGVVAQGVPGKGALSDGKVTRFEIERALFLTAKGADDVSISAFPLLLPDSAARFVYAGYGIVDAKTAEEALAVVLGEKAAPVRSNDDTWASIDSDIRRSIWGSYDAGGQAAPQAPSDPQAWRSALLQAVLG